MVSLHRSGGTTTDQIAPEAEAAALPAPASSAAFPRVNLMPDVVAAEARVHRAKTALVVAAVASVAVVGGLYAMATGSVSSAQDQLDSATAQHAALNAEAAKYADVPKVQAQVANAQTQMYQALGAEVRWSFLLNNLSLTIPAGVSLVNFAGTVSEAPPAGAPVPGAKESSTPDAQFTSVLGTPGIGSISYSGEALGYPQVAAFLDAQAKQVALVDPYVSSVQVGGASAAPGAKAPTSLTFTSTATVSDKALSHRYDIKAGS